MGFDFQHTNIADIAKLATLAGRANQANAQIDRDERAMQQLRSIEASKQMAEFNAELDMKRMQFDASKQLDAEMRSHEWQMQKMQITSQLDFEREEKKRMRALGEYDAAISYIDSSDIFDEEDKERYKFKAKMKLLNQDVTDRSIFPELYQSQTQEKQVSPSQKISAIKALQGDEFQDPGFSQKVISTMTGGVFGQSELDPDVQAQKDILESVVRGEYNAQPSSGVSSTTAEPSDVDTFENTVAQLKQVDMTQAKAYYNKWAGKF